MKQAVVREPNVLAFRHDSSTKPKSETTTGDQVLQENRPAHGILNRMPALRPLLTTVGPSFVGGTDREFNQAHLGLDRECCCHRYHLLLEWLPLEPAEALCRT